MLTDAKRRIDQIWVSDPAASSPHMRAGMPKEPKHGIGSDHRPMITDIGIDCAGMANGTAPLWDPHTVTTLRAKKGVTEEDRAEMNRKFQGSMDAGEQGALDLDSRGATTTIALQEAMEGQSRTRYNNSTPSGQQRQSAGRDGATGWMHGARG